MRFDDRARTIAFLLIMVLISVIIAGAIVADAQEPIQREQMTCAAYGEMANEDTTALLNIINNQESDADGTYTIYFAASQYRRDHEDVLVPASCEEANYLMVAYFGAAADWAINLTIKQLDPGGADLYDLAIESAGNRFEDVSAGIQAFD